MNISALVHRSWVILFLVLIAGCGSKQTESEKQAALVKPFVDRGFLAFRSADYKKAVEEWSEALRINPELDYLYTNIGQAYYFSDEKEKALEYWTKYLEKYPKNAHVYNNIGSYYKDKKDYAKAIEYYQNSIQNHSSYILPLYNLGLIYYQTREFELALENVEKALQISPKDLRLGVLKGRIFMEMGQTDKAIETLKQCKELGPTDPEPKVLLAELFIERGNFEDARVEIETAYAQYPDFPLICYPEALLLIAQKQDLARVPELITKVIQFNADETGKYKLALGNGYLVAEQYDQAKVALTEAISALNPGAKSKLALAHYLLGRAAMALNDRATAQQHFQQALEVDPATSVREEIETYLKQLAG